MCSTKQHNKQFKTSCKSHYQNLCPNGWICVNLGELCSIFSTGPFGSMVHKSDYVEKDGVPLVNPINISNGIVSKKKLMMVSEEKATELHRYKLNRDDIVIARRGDLSKCAIITEIEEGWLCGTGSFFLHIPLVEPKYFELFYLSDYMQSKLDKECVGATMNNLNQGVLGNVLFMLPPHAEQKRILSEVQKWFSLIDTLKESREDLFQIIEKTKAKVLDLAIQGELALQNPSEEPAIELLKRINPNIKIPCDNPHYPYEIPKNWAWVKLKELCSFLSRGKSPKYSEIRKYPVFAQKCNLYNGDISLDQARFLDPSTISKWDEKYKLLDGDVLVNSTGTGTVGRTRLFHSNCLGDYPFVVPDSHVSVVRTFDSIDSRYIHAYLSSVYTQLYLEDHLAGSTNQKELYIGVLENLLIPLPPQSEQGRIADEIERYSRVLDKIKESLTA